MSFGSRTNFSYLSNGVICILKQVDRKLILPRVITLPHFPLGLYGIQHDLSYVENVVAPPPLSPSRLGIERHMIFTQMSYLLFT